MNRREFILAGIASAMTCQPPRGWAQAAQTIREAAKTRGIEVGGFVTVAQLANSKIAGLFAENFTLAANLFEEMEWDANPGFDADPAFSDLNFFLDNCKNLGLRPRGRQVYSHEALPANAHLRADGTPKSKSELEKTLVRRAEQACRPLRGRNAIIQVMDEILADHEGGIRKDPFSNALGERYVDILFQAAHEAAPDALLIYQEFGPEINPQKWFKRKTKDYLSLLERLRKRNVPITGAALGGFMHPDLTLRVPFFQRIANLDYDIHITELTQIYGIRGEPKRDGWWPRSIEENNRIVADRYVRAFKFLCELKRLREVTFFAPIDRMNTIETGTLGVEPYSGARPGVFNQDLSPKQPLYGSIVEAISRSKPNL